jgi:ABC-type amino acid transport system permease subunit
MMRSRIIKIALTVWFCSLAWWATAQKVEITERDYDNQTVEMADQFRADGKIYVVVAVIATVLGGLAVYLFALDRQIGRLEKMTKDKTP